MRFKHIAFLFFIPLFFSAQNEYIDYRSVTNPLYWKNRKPFEGYWQQDVHYNINADLNDSTDVISAKEELTYWNNSPYDLSFVYFHLYANAQTKDSYTSDLYKSNGYNLKYGKYREKDLGTQVESMQVDGKELKTELDNTVLKVWLPKPVKSGESVTFNIKFKTYFDKEAIRNRMKVFNSFGSKQYDIVHWYPRISVFDRKMAWDTHQHMDHEFYGDFGSFHVELTLPNNYICDGTGIMTNESEMLPDTLRKKLDISNFLKKPWNSPPSVIIKKDGTKKTWKFSSINVHDVAYTCDPNYRIGESKIDDIRCIALVQEPHAAGWYNASQYLTKIIEVNSYNIGPYHYPKMISADAQDGMEYPMITLNGGYDPGYRGLFIHELTHNWFFGMVGSNETYRPSLDEGFTQFYTADTYQFIDGPFEIDAKPKPKSVMDKYVAEYTKPVKVVDADLYTPYYNANVTKDEQVTLNTHGDDFNGGIRHGGGYSQVYFKTAVMLKNLEYVLGRALFDKAMQFYFYQWKFCHPYPEDFRNSITQFTGQDLNWFFDEWMETTKTIDYKIGKIKYKGNGNYNITFKRKGSMEMPLDFAIIDGNDSARHYYIPNTWFEKPTNATTLPRWIGWGPKLRTTYTASINVNSGIKNVIIDPSKRMADIDMTNNMKKGRVNVRLDSKVYNPPNWKQYDMRLRPSVWYNGYDGMKIGLALSGDYLMTKHVFDLTAWFSSGVLQSWIKSSDRVNSYNPLSFILNYKTSLNRYIRKANFYMQLKSLDGLDGATIGLEKKSNNERFRFYTHYKGMLRDIQPDMIYLINPTEWGYQKFNSAMHFGFDHNYRYKRGTGFINFNTRASAFTNDYDYSAMTLCVVNKNDLGKININTRVFGQFGFGKIMPSESMLFVAGANNEELMDNKFTRSYGMIPRDWGGYGDVTNHFTAGGGLNLRGYSGYLLAEQNPDGSLSYQYKGSTGAAFNAELEFGELFSFMNRLSFKNTIKIQPYLFGDVGVININKPGQTIVMSDVMADAGVGATFNIMRWGQLSGLKPLSIRFDMPFFISRLPYAEKDYVQFRWMIGVNRAF
jgi:hypothetical protein